jgi:hypothetical protein
VSVDIYSKGEKVRADAALRQCKPFALLPVCTGEVRGQERDTQLEVVYGSLQEKEDLNGPLPYLWLSGKNWSGGSVGRT